MTYAAFMFLDFVGWMFHMHKSLLGPSCVSKKQAWETEKHSLSYFALAVSQSFPQWHRTYDFVVLPFCLISVSFGWCIPSLFTSNFTFKNIKENYEVNDQLRFCKQHSHLQVQLSHFPSPTLSLFSTPLFAVISKSQWPVDWMTWTQISSKSRGCVMSPGTYLTKMTGSWYYCGKIKPK